MANPPAQHPGLPDTSAVEQFEQAARIQEETSSDSRFASKKAEATLHPLDANLVLEERGEPKEV